MVSKYFYFLLLLSLSKLSWASGDTVSKENNTKHFLHLELLGPTGIVAPYYERTLLSKSFFSVGAKFGIGVSNSKQYTYNPFYFLFAPSPWGTEPIFIREVSGISPSIAGTMFFVIERNIFFETNIGYRYDILTVERGEKINSKTKYTNYAPWLLTGIRIYSKKSNFVFRMFVSYSNHFYKERSMIRPGISLSARFSS